MYRPTPRPRQDPHARARGAIEPSRGAYPGGAVASGGAGGGAVHEHRRLHDRDAPRAPARREPGDRHGRLRLDRLLLHLRGRRGRLGGGTDP
ncbi:MAG: hypothetical protein ACK56I_26610, partial [bacterium]